MKNNNDIGKKILINLFKNNEVISASIVGSYSENKRVDKVGDIDVVVICKKLSKKIIKKLIKRLYSIQKKILKKKIIINSSFGPLKINSHHYLPIHLMIYDINSHIDHVTSSPFTCYDWERSNWFKGIHLKNIYPVTNLQLRDFFNSRRSATEYLSDLSQNRISIREHKYKKNKVIFKKKFIKIDPRNRGEFVYHIINFLVLNLNKFLKNENIKIKDKDFDKLFLKVTKNDRIMLAQFKSLKSQKENKVIFYNPKIILLAKRFMGKYDNYLREIKRDICELNFVRHAKTSMNTKSVFLGSGSDPDIIKPKKVKILGKYDYIITSNLKRSYSSARFYKSKEIIKNNLLNEINYGKAEGLTYKVLKKKYPEIIKGWRKSIDIKYPGGENTSNVKKRVIKFFKYLQKIKPRKKILVISHSFFLRVLLGIMLKFDLKRIYKLKIEHLKMFQATISKKYLISNLERKEIQKFYKQLND
tara:strand:+ start:1 stop:1419 length:1419 start_codon:yes stop_codon:yes gene_type:complete